MAKTGLLFPGQGSQTVAMGKALIESSEIAQNIYTLADQTLGFELSKIILEGPEEKLKDTAIAQPAILTASIAAWEVVKSQWQPKDPGDVICAGHSLGEYSALVASEVITFEDTLRLVSERGKLMQAAAAATNGGMAAVIGLAEAEVAVLCKEADANGQVQIANLNCPGQIVVSGAQSGLEKLSEIAQSKGIRVIPLAVSGPFHSDFMKPAAEQLKPALESATFKNGIYPVIANVSATPVTEPDQIQKALIEQVCGSVRWTDSINYMIKQGITTMIEIGPGKVLRGLMKKIDRTIKVVNAFSPDEIVKAVDQLKLN